MTTFTEPKPAGYTVGRKVGSGTFADVYRGYKTIAPEEPVAIKCVDRLKLSKRDLNNFISEIEILKALDHRFIVRLKDFSWNSTHMFLIMEYSSGGNLSSVISKTGRISEKVCQRYLQQLMSALRYLRERNISHFDLKPQNLLLASRNYAVLKVGDFGLAQHMTDIDTATTIKGSPLYMAPEILLHNHYDARADIWSVGIILYECLFGRAPYSSDSLKQLAHKIKNDDPILTIPRRKISDNCKSFLYGCLQKDLDKRFTFDEFFNHPFIDLKHAASEESRSRATEMLHKATVEEEKGDACNAFNYYNEAVAFLLPLMHIEECYVNRCQIKEEINKCINKMEIIKSESTQSSDKVETSDKFKTFMQEENSPTDFSELIRLSKTTPALTAPIEIAKSAELYALEEKYVIALEKYEMAIGALLSLLKKEPVGRRKKLLGEAVQYWLRQAESVKAIVNGTAGTNTIAMAEENLSKSCCIQ